MAKAIGRDLTLSEVLQTLEHGQRMFRAFQHAEDLIRQVEAARAELDRVNAELADARDELVKARALAKSVRAKADRRVEIAA